MSTRERWMIYPLLFLALGAALRDKLTASVDSRFVTCEDLEIVDHQGQVQMRLTSHDGDSGKLLVLDRGDPRVVISSNKEGGTVTAVDSERNLFITLGHERDRSGVMAENHKNRATFSARFEPIATRRAGPQTQRSQQDGSQPPAAQAQDQPSVPNAPSDAAVGQGWQSGAKIP